MEESKIQLSDKARQILASKRQRVVVEPQVEFTEQDMTSIAEARGKKGFPAVRPGSFVDGVKFGSQIYRNLAEIEADLGATPDLNTVHYQRKHPVPGDIESDL